MVRDSIVMVLMSNFVGEHKKKTEKKPTRNDSPTKSLCSTWRCQFYAANGNNSSLKCKWKKIDPILSGPILFYSFHFCCNVVVSWLARIPLNTQKNREQEEWWKCLQGSLFTFRSTYKVCSIQFYFVLLHHFTHKPRPVLQWDA